MRQDIKIGLFGFGCVGKGLYDVLSKTPGLRAEILKICCKDKDKIRPIGMEHFTFNRHELLDNNDINVIVELIDDAEAAMEIVREAISKGKAVVTANKKMIAHNFSELLDLQNKYKTPILYEGAVCASIPIIRNLEEYYDNDLLHSIKGIVNGTTNHVLTKMFNERINFKKALQSAKDNGFAETDPTLDIEGFDAKYKLQIILAHAYGMLKKPEEILNAGISRISLFDANFADEKGYKIKLVAKAFKLSSGDVSAYVLPHFVHKRSELYNVDDVFNGITIESCFAEKQVFIGKGAGAFPTASAVLSDISALTYKYKYEYKKMKQQEIPILSNDFKLVIYLRSSLITNRDLSYFGLVKEQYTSEAASYVLGTISFQKIIEAGWIDNPDYALIAID